MNNTTATPKAIIFDMDGILIDSESICDIAWQIVFKNLNIKDNTNAIQECRGCNKIDTAIILRKIFGQDFDSEGFLAQTSAEFHKIEEARGVPPMHYAKEILEYLSPKYPLALASSTRCLTATRQLKNLNLYDFFKTLTFGDQVEHSKPHPEIYLKACKSLNQNPADCVAIEDSPNGIKSAFSAGLKVIMIPDKIQPSPEIKEMCWKICNSLEDLKNIF